MLRLADPGSFTTHRTVRLNCRWTVRHSLRHRSAYIFTINPADTHLRVIEVALVPNTVLPSRIASWPVDTALPSIPPAGRPPPRGRLIVAQVVKRIYNQAVLPTFFWVYVAWSLPVVCLTSKVALASRMTSPLPC
jgi:hypothetical protein